MTSTSADAPPLAPPSVTAAAMFDAARNSSGLQGVSGELAGSETLLVFGLSGEAFALPVTTIHEVIDPLPVTPVPNAPVHAPGLINVRGIVTPVIDVRLRLRIPPRLAEAPSGRIIVLELPVDGTITRVAIGADVVHEVIEADPARIEIIPELGARWPEAYVRGVARHNGSLVVLLDPETLFAPDADRPAVPS